MDFRVSKTLSSEPLHQHSCKQYIHPVCPAQAGAVVVEVGLYDQETVKVCRAVHMGM